VGGVNGFACPYAGSISQTIHVGSNKRLKFDWREARETNPDVYNPFGQDFQVTITDAYSGTILANMRPRYTSHSAGLRRSEVDLSAFAGLDVKVAFSSNGSCNLFPAISAWVDSVRLDAGPIPSYSGIATAGNWYNPSRSGSGWDLRQAPDGSFYAIWYTYDAALQPIWYITSAGGFINGRFQASLLKCTLAGSTASCPAVGSVDLTLTSSSQGEMRFDFDNAGTPGEWDGEEFFTLLTPAGGALSGHFHSNDAADPAWGITTMSFSFQNQQNLFATMYYYNGSEPTWAVGTGTASNITSVNMMRLSGGLCPQCVGTYPAITQQSVGMIDLNFTGSNPGLFATVNISSWLRPSRPYYMLSN